MRSPNEVAGIWVEPEIILDPTYYDRGAAARRREHADLADLADLADVFDTIEQRADTVFDELIDWRA